MFNLFIFSDKMHNFTDHTIIFWKIRKAHSSGYYHHHRYHRPNGKYYNKYWRNNAYVQLQQFTDLQLISSQIWSTCQTFQNCFFKLQGKLFLIQVILNIKCMRGGDERKSCGVESCNLLYTFSKPIQLCHFCTVLQWCCGYNSSVFI